MTRTWIRAAMLAAPLMMMLLAAPAGAALEPGKDYRTLQAPQPGTSGNKIEVIEFFSYGCPHCYALHPLIMKWSERLPEDVAFKRIAVGFGRSDWTALAHAFYALESSGELKKYDSAIFDAVHGQRLRLGDEQSISTWVGRQGGDAKKFATAYKSFGVNNRVQQAERMVLAYRVDEVPRIVVDGRYVVMGRTYEDMVRIADELVAKVRAERKTAQRPPQPRLPAANRPS